MYIFFHIMEGQAIARISYKINQSLIFFEKVVQIYHKNLDAFKINEPNK